MTEIERIAAGGEGRYQIAQDDLMGLTVLLGSFGYIEQGDCSITIERHHALELSDRLAAWGAHAAHLEQHHAKD